MYKRQWTGPRDLYVKVRLYNAMDWSEAHEARPFLQRRRRGTDAPSVRTSRTARRAGWQESPCCERARGRSVVLAHPLEILGDFTSLRGAWPTRSPRGRRVGRRRKPSHHPWPAGCSGRGDGGGVTDAALLSSGRWPVRRSGVTVSCWRGLRSVRRRTPWRQLHCHWRRWRRPMRRAWRERRGRIRQALP